MGVQQSGDNKAGAPGVRVGIGYDVHAFAEGRRLRRPAMRRRWHGERRRRRNVPLNRESVGFPRHQAAADGPRRRRGHRSQCPPEPPARLPYCVQIAERPFIHPALHTHGRLTAFSSSDCAAMPQLQSCPPGQLFSNFASRSPQPLAECPFSQRARRRRWPQIRPLALACTPR